MVGCYCRLEAVGFKTHSDFGATRTGSTLRVHVNQACATRTCVLVRVHTVNLSCVQKEETRVRKRLNLLGEVEWQSEEESGVNPGSVGLDRRAAHPGGEGGGCSVHLSEDV